MTNQSVGVAEELPYVAVEQLLRDKINQKSRGKAVHVEHIMLTLG